MKRILKVFAVLMLTLVISCGIAFGGAYGYVHKCMAEENSSYTVVVENILVGLVPVGGITVRGRNYDANDVRNFLDEIRYDPNNYEHKYHTCLLQYIPATERHIIVNTLSVIMGCK